MRAHHQELQTAGIVIAGSLFYCTSCDCNSQNVIYVSPLLCVMETVTVTLHYTVGTTVKYYMNSF